MRGRKTGIAETHENPPPTPGCAPTPEKPTNGLSLSEFGKMIIYIARDSLAAMLNNEDSPNAKERPVAPSKTKWPPCGK